MVANDWAAAAPVAIAVTERDGCRVEDLRTASGVLAQCGRMGEALPFATAAVQAAPGNAEFALHAGCIANQVGDHTGAIAFLLQSARLDAGIAETYRQLAWAAERLGSLENATRLALRAHLLDPTDPHSGMNAAHLLSRQNRFEEAVRMVTRVIETAGSAPFVQRALAHYREQIGDHAGALEAIDKALADDPNNADYHGFRAFMLIELGRRDEADAALQRALDLDPGNLASRRHAISILVDKGDLERALRYGGDLLARAPDEPEFADCMRFLLDVKSMNVAAGDFSEIAALKRAAPPRRLVEPPTFLEASWIQWRTIVALVLRDIRSRYGESRIGFFWVLLEPFLHIGILAVVFQFTMHGSPPMGQDFFLFYFTGVMPYLLLSHLAMHLAHAVKGYRHLMQIPTITPVDLLLSRAIVEVFTTGLIFLIFLGLFHAAGVDATPVAPQNVVLAFAVTWVLGTGIGFVLAALAEFGAAAESMMSIVLRLVYFASGIFYVPGKLPVFARDILVWNPFLHLVDLMRVGFFETYDPPWLDVPYSITCAIVVLLLGMTSVATLHRRMRSIA